MEAKHKELYEAPSATVFEVKVEGVICASGVEANRSDYGDATEYNWS